MCIVLFIFFIVFIIILFMLLRVIIMNNAIFKDSEYMDTIDRLMELQEIKIKYQKMSEFHEYNAHLDLPSSFNELLLLIKRENEEIDLNVRRITIEFLATKSKDERNKYKEMIYYLITSMKSGFDLEEDFKIPIVLDNLYQNLKPLISKKNANLMLQDEVLRYENEYINLVNKKVEIENRYNNIFKKIRALKIRKRN